MFEEIRTEKFQIYENYIPTGLRSLINPKDKCTKKTIPAYQNRCFETSGKEKIMKAARGKETAFPKKGLKVRV